MTNLGEFEVTNFESVGDAIGRIYKDKVIQVYWGESGGTRSYADYETTQNMYVEGRVIWGSGNVFALECEVETPNKVYMKQCLFNAWGVTFISEKDNVDILSILKGKI